MSLKLLLLSLICLITLVVSLTFPALAAPDQPGIIGGEEAVPGAWPWQAALVHSDAPSLYDGQFCGGVLVDEFWVVTAAHCVEDFDILDFDVALGVHNLLTPEPNFQRINPDSIIINPDYKPDTYDSDIALIKLETPVVLTEGEGGGLPVRPAELVAADAGSLQGIMSTVSGWGNRLGQPDPGGYDYPETLYQVELPILTNDVCNQTFANNYLFGQVTDNMMCAGFIYKGGRDSCFGDSGGPLVIQKPDGQEWQLAGLVSWGYGCGLPGLPGVYTRVSAFTDWITEIVQRPNVTITKSASATAVRPGDAIDYTLLIKNAGSRSLEDLELRDALPGGTTAVPGSISGSGVLEGDIVVWTVPTLAMNETFTAEFSVLVDEDFLSTAVYFADDLEGDLGVWSTAHDPAFADSDWSLTNSFPFSGSYAWFAPNLDVISDQFLILTLPGTLPPDMLLSFWHYYQFEGGYDGGVIEISSDGGKTWSDLGPEILTNGYDLQLYGGTGNPLSGRYAFSSNSGDWIQTRVSLAAYESQEVQIRFRLGTDEIFGALGWYVDDILIGRRTQVNNQAEINGVTSNITETAVMSWLPTNYAYIPVLIPEGNGNTYAPDYP